MLAQSAKAGVAAAVATSVTALVAMLILYLCHRRMKRLAMGHGRPQHFQALRTKYEAQALRAQGPASVPAGRAPASLCRIDESEDAAERGLAIADGGSNSSSSRGGGSKSGALGGSAVGARDSAPPQAHTTITLTAPLCSDPYEAASPTRAACSACPEAECCVRAPSVTVNTTAGAVGSSELAAEACGSTAVQAQGPAQPAPNAGSGGGWRQPAGWWARRAAREDGGAAGPAVSAGGEAALRRAWQLMAECEGVRANGVRCRRLAAAAAAALPLLELLLSAPSPVGGGGRRSNRAVGPESGTRDEMYGTLYGALEAALQGCLQYVAAWSGPGAGALMAEQLMLGQLEPGPWHGAYVEQYERLRQLVRQLGDAVQLRVAAAAGAAAAGLAGVEEAAGWVDGGGGRAQQAPSPPLGGSRVAHEAAACSSATQPVPLPADPWFGEALAGLLGQQAPAEGAGLPATDLALLYARVGMSYDTCVQRVYWRLATALQQPQQIPEEAVQLASEPEQQRSLRDGNDLALPDLLVGSAGVGRSEACLWFRASWKGADVLLLPLPDEAVLRSDEGLSPEQEEELFLCSQYRHPNVLPLLGVCRSPMAPGRLRATLVLQHMREAAPPAATAAAAAAAASTGWGPGGGGGGGRAAGGALAGQRRQQQPHPHQQQRQVVSLEALMLAREPHQHQGAIGGGVRHAPLLAAPLSGPLPSGPLGSSPELPAALRLCLAVEAAAALLFLHSRPLRPHSLGRLGAHALLWDGRGDGTLRLCVPLASSRLWGRRGGCCCGGAGGCGGSGEGGSREGGSWDDGSEWQPGPAQVGALGASGSREERAGEASGGAAGHCGGVSASPSLLRLLCLAPEQLRLRGTDSRGAAMGEAGGAAGGCWDAANGSSSVVAEGAEPQCGRAVWYRGVEGAVAGGSTEGGEAAADVYALGVLVCGLLYGMAPLLEVAEGCEPQPPMLQGGVDTAAGARGARGSGDLGGRGPAAAAGGPCAAAALHDCVARRVLAGGRPRVPDEAPPALRACLAACWRADPRARPRAAQVVEVLTGLAQ